MPVYKDNQHGTWFVKCRYKDYTGTTKFKTKRGFKLKEDAKNWEHDFLANRQEDPTMLFSALASAFLEDKKTDRRIKISTYETIKSRIYKWILPTFKDKKINSITKADVRKWQNHLQTASGRTNKPLSDQYIFNLVRQLSSIFNYGRIYGLKENPVAELASTGYSAGEKKKSEAYWTKKQFEKFISTFPEHDTYYTIFMILYWTGIRLGELQALTVADILPDRIIINKTYHVYNGQEVVTKPKTKRSIREVEIPSELYAIIEEHKKKLYHPRKTDRLFLPGSTTIMKHFKDHIKLAELPEIRLHDIRHSHASLLINNGADALLVCDRLGHKDPSMTLSIYSHLFESRKNDLSDMLSKLWFE